MATDRKYLFIIFVLIVLFIYYLNTIALLNNTDYKNNKVNRKENIAALNQVNLYDDQQINLQKSKLRSIGNMLDVVENDLNQNNWDSSKITILLKNLRSIINDQSQNDELDEIKLHLKVYDLNIPNNNNFECVKSKKIVVQTTICIHDIQRDIFVSGSIKSAGVWEYGLVELFMRMINSKKNINVLDIGAHLGQYSLYAAKFGRKCISVEPFYDSYIRFHKSIIEENLQDKIILLTNGLSDKRGEFRKLQLAPKNVGGQTLLNDPTDYSSRKNETVIKIDKYIVETILMDDIVHVLPPDFNDCIMKIDIEGYEIKAFKKASKLFSKLNILAVFMEWLGKTDNKYFNEEQIFELLAFFTTREYEILDPATFQTLDKVNWRSWPGDIVFVKKGFKF